MTNHPAAFMVGLLAFLILVVSVPLGSYRVLPTRYENCFTPQTPCGKLSGEQRNPSSKMRHRAAEEPPGGTPSGPLRVCCGHRGDRSLPALASAAMDLAQICRDTGADIDDVRILAEAGLELDQIVQLLEDPVSPVSWATTVETSDNVQVDEDGAVRLLAAAVGERTCGWAITKHDGSAFAIRCARLTLRTDWCWDHQAVLSHQAQHSTSTTAYGGASGWRVEPSAEGSSGWISEPDLYRVEVKADWKLVIPSGQEVQSGTAFARHLIDARGTVKKEAGGWP